jgi:hypothetical protein
MGQPTQLGCFFSKQDAYGFGMIIATSVGGKTMKTGVGGAILRVKKKLLFVYLNAEYKNEDTIKWLRKATEQWSDAVLQANQ